MRQPRPRPRSKPDEGDVEAEENCFDVLDLQHGIAAIRDKLTGLPYIQVLLRLLKKGDCFADRTKCESHLQLITCIEKYQEKESIGYMILGTPITGWKTVLLALVGPVGTVLVKIATR